MSGGVERLSEIAGALRGVKDRPSNMNRQILDAFLIEGLLIVEELVSSGTFDAAANQKAVADAEEVRQVQKRSGARRPL